MTDYDFIDAQQSQKTVERLTEIADNNESVQVKTQTIFAKVCIACAPLANLDLKDLAAEITGVMDPLLTRQETGSLDLDPLLLINISLMLKKKGLNINALDELIAKIASELNQQTGNIKQIGRVRHISRLLQNGGWAVELATIPKKNKKHRQAVAEWLTLPENDLIELVDHYHADALDLSAQESQILALIAIGELRNNNMHVGCKLLQLVFEQGVLSTEAEEALLFIALQRRRDGTYGFTDPLLEEQDTTEKQELKFFLPMTVNAVRLFNLYAQQVSQTPVERQDIA